MRFTWRMFFVVGIIASVTARAAMADTVPTPDDIFKHHAVAVGYSMSDGNAKPYTLESTSSWKSALNQPRSLQTIRNQAGPYYREDNLYEDATRSDGFSDGIFWTSTPNNNLTSRTGYSRPIEVTRSVIGAEGFDSSLAAELRPDTSAYYIVRIHPPGGIPADVYFDKTTWLIDQVILDPDGVASRESFSDYKKQGPVMVAMTRTMDRVTIKVDKFVWDAPLTVDDLAPPKLKPYATFPASGTTTVPFDPHGGIIIEASVNGVPGRFAIDSGNSGIVLDAVMADKARLISGELPQFDFFEAAASKTASTVSIGGLTLSNVKVAVWSDNFGDFMYGQTDYDGIIGYDVLSQVAASVDFDHLTVTFTDPTRFVPDASYAALPVAMDDGVPQLAVIANNATPVYAQVMSGVNERAILFQSFMRRHRDVADSDGTYVGSIKTLQLGPFRLTDVRTAPFAFDSSVAPETDSEGMLGYNILRAFDIAFDLSHDMIYLKPNGKSI